MMTLDPKRLKRDSKHAQVDRPGSAIGREITGVTRAVRQNVSVIRQLRAEGVTWAAIAQAMSAQGITQSGGRALTATRLTAVFSEVEARTRRSQASTRRKQRPDLAPRMDPVGAHSSMRGPDPPAFQHLLKLDSPNHATEEDIRRAGLAELKNILRKK
jgi:DNA-binding transcriptional MerR regulator